MNAEDEQRGKDLSSLTVSAESFDEVDFEAPLSGLSEVDSSSLRTAYFSASDLSQGDADTGSLHQASVFGLLAQLCGMHFRPTNKAEPFSPVFQDANGRTSVPVDYIGAQSVELEKVVPKTRHPALRARLADVAWLNRKAAAEMARIAVDAYCEMSEGLASGRFKAAFEGGAVSNEEIGYVQRALTISRRLAGRRGPLEPRAVSAALNAFERAIDEGQPVTFTHVAETVREYGLVEDAVLAAVAEQVFAKASALKGIYPLALKPVLALAASLYARSGKSEDARRCELAAVDQTLAMASGGNAAAHWTRIAIGELRWIENTKEQVEQLRDRLRFLQEAATDSYTVFSQDLDLGELQTTTINEFEKLSASEALRRFALITQPRSADKAREEALASYQSGFISNLFGSVYTDEEGKVVAETPAAEFGAAGPGEEWIANQISRNLDIWRNITVGGRVSPARSTIYYVHGLTIRHLLPLVVNSPFVSASYHYTVAIGLAAFLSGDMIPAAHCLIPQLENGVRYILKTSGKDDASSIMSDLTQEDRSLSAIFEHSRDAVAAILGPDLTLDLEMLLLRKPGPALRHELAHGKLSSGGCYSPAAVYACWLILHIMCLPLLDDWTSAIAPSIEAAC